MIQSNIIRQLKIDFHSSDHAIAQHACDRLVETGGQEVLDYFLSLLDQDNVKLRDLAALGLHDLADNNALVPLLKAINQPKNQGHNGTMAYALETLDCSKELSAIFDLLFYGDAEVKMAATTILDEQTFDSSEQEIQNIQHKWHDIKMYPDKCPFFDSHKHIIAHCIDKYSTL